MYRNRRPPRPLQRKKPDSGFNHPSLKAALIMLLPMLLILWLRLSAISIGIFWFFLPQAICYLIAGNLAARFYDFRPVMNRKITDQSVQYGAGAGLMLWILYWVSFALIALVWGEYISLYTTLIGTGLLLFGCFDFLFALSLGALGSKFR